VLIIVIVQSVVLSVMFPAAPLFADDLRPPERTKNASLRNPAILAIRSWQVFSRNVPFHILDCQFRPSCSEYGVAAIQEAGTLRGMLYSTDRIMRCNPGARRYYARGADGKLRDDFRRGPYFESRNAPAVFIPLSLVLPGLNKMVNGRFCDGLTTLLVTDATGYALYESFRNDSWLSIPCTIGFSLFFGSDVYFNGLSIGGKEGGCSGNSR
jgi:putative component of membrane protein insertase Oxa1/YidC/SpoIIIJ protein YidD